MNTTNKAKDAQRHLEILPTATANAGRDGAVTPEAVSGNTAGEAHGPTSMAKGGLVDPAEPGRAGGSRRAPARKKSGDVQAQDSTPTSADPRPARAKRTKAPDIVHAEASEGATNKPRRASGKKAATERASESTVPPELSDIPPITPAAIEFLGKHDATFADMIKLGPESLEFVRYHLKRMQQLEVDSRQASAYLAGRTRPVSPALQRLVDSLPESGKLVGVDGRLKNMEVMFPVMGTATTPSYAHTATGFAAGGMFITRFHIRNSSPPSAVQQSTDSANFSAPDINEGRGIRGGATAHLSTGAMIEGSEARPSNRAGLAGQASGSMEPGAMAPDIRVTDWDVAYEAGSALGDLAGVETPLTREAIMSLAGRTIAAIRGIETPQYRNQVLAVSHQVGLWHPHYDAEFRRQAPDLAAAAEAAYKVEETRKEPEGGVHRITENSIERGTVRLVERGQDTKTNVPEVDSHTSPTSRASGESPTASATLDRQETVGIPKLPGVGRRLLLVIMNAMKSTSDDRDASGDPSAPVGRVPSGSFVDSADIMPPSVARSFLKVEHEYFFHDRTPAFSDRGNKLATRGANLEVIRSFIEIAKARGWDAITVAGTDEFRRSAWLEASRNGVLVTGYKPTALDLAGLANSPIKNSVEKRASHGGNPGSNASAAEVPVKRDEPGHPVAQAESDTPTQKVAQADPELVAKAKAFQDNKPAFVVKKYPDLAAAYGVIAAAKVFAAEKLPELAREEFVEMASRHMVEKISKGEQIHGPRIYLTAVKANGRENPVQNIAKIQQQGTSQQGNVLEKER